VTDNRHRLLIGLLNLLKIIDLLIVISSFGLTTILTVHAQKNVSLAGFLSMRTRISNFLIFLSILYIYHLVFRMFGLYRSRRLSTRRAELADILKATTLSSALFVVISAILSIRMVTVPFVLIFWVITILVLCGSRVAFRITLFHIRARGRNLRYLLIFGTNPRAVAFAQEIAASPERGCRLLGFVDDEWPGIAQCRDSGFRVICDYARLPDFLRSNVVDEAVIYLPFGSFYHHWSELARLCAHHGIIVRLNSDTFGLNNARWLTEEVGDGHYIATHTGVGEGWPLAVKRTLDIAISSVLLLLLAPVLIGVAIAVKLTSTGPVLFLQDRIGLNKRRFRICKFRTMVPNAEQLLPNLESRNEVSGPVFKIRNDPRITRIGRFLRRSSIDELPQLFNVLKGDMSLVGPRPLPVRDYEGFSEDWQRRRFSIKPGITCLWQVNGRSGISFDQWMLLDLKYMDEWSLWLDLKILARTVPAVMRGSGAA
jgi:exopolysaccharide biosynthesis polyprenyl glycosylphosphotransferase